MEPETILTEIKALGCGADRNLRKIIPFWFCIGRGVLLYITATRNARGRARARSRLGHAHGVDRGVPREGVRPARRCRIVTLL